MALLIEMTDQISYAYNLMENSHKNIFLTGRAGTGKSTLLKYFIENTKKNVVVLAPTGVSAINVGGQTIHSFFKFGIDITSEKIKKVPGHLGKLYKSIETIVIDEISMVRADLFDYIDKFMRLNGKRRRSLFGGVQMILIGDIYQLPPVVKGSEKEIFKKIYKGQYFFNSEAFNKSEFEYIELDKIFRQSDQRFIDILNSIRNNTIDEDRLKILNTRVDEDFIPLERDMYIHLTTTNKLADKINNIELSKIDSEVFTFYGQIEGEFDESLLPTDLELNLKVGAQVMLINNDPLGRWVNGTIGRIIDFVGSKEETVIFVELESGEEVEVNPHKWKIIRYVFDEDKKRIKTEEVGSFFQYPIILAWAITIHKSQGKTFNKVIIDIGSGTFAHGQLYVALSRCRSLDGLILRRPIEKRHIIMDRRVVNFITSIQYQQAEKELPIDEKRKIIEDAIRDGMPLEIIYLKKTDEKSIRKVLPLFVGELNYNEKTFLGLKAVDLGKNEERHFRLDRILDIKISENKEKN